MRYNIRLIIDNFYVSVDMLALSIRYRGFGGLAGSLVLLLTAESACLLREIHVKAPWFCLLHMTYLWVNRQSVELKRQLSRFWK